MLDGITPNYCWRLKYIHSRQADIVHTVEQVLFNHCVSGQSGQIANLTIVIVNPYHNIIIVYAQGNSNSFSRKTHNSQSLETRNQNPTYGKSASKDSGVCVSIGE